MERTNQLLAICLLCVCLALIALTLGLVLSENGNLRKDDNGEVVYKEGDDFIFGVYDSENFPDDPIEKLPAFINGSASAEVTRGTSFGLLSEEDEDSINREGTKVLGRYCRLNFKFTVGRRPATSEVVALMDETALFLGDQISDAWSINYVDVELNDWFLPTRAVPGATGDESYDWAVSFNTQVWVKSSALEDRNDLADLMQELDWNDDYRTNYASQAVVGEELEWDIFTTAIQVTYQKAAPPRPPGRGERQLLLSDHHKQ